MFEAAGVIVSVSESFKSAIEDKLLAGSVQEAAGAVVPASETVFGVGLTVVAHSSSGLFERELSAVGFVVCWILTGLDGLVHSLLLRFGDSCWLGCLKLCLYQRPTIHHQSHSNLQWRMSC